MVKKTPCHIPTTQQKVSLAKFLIAPIAEKVLPLNAIKINEFPIRKKRKFFGKTD